MTEDKYLSVNVITQYITKKFEVDPYMQKVYIKGEISNVKIYKDGHIYFSLKDESSVIPAMMFYNDARRLKFDIAEGQSVLINGRIGVYTRYGRYQLYATEMSLDGRGKLFEQLERDKKDLIKRGMLDERHKKRLPLFPESIGILTSISGAVKRDMLIALRRRYPLVKVTLIDTKVQGVNSEFSVIENLKYADTLGFDVIILARGGGSIEDLWTFNLKTVAEAVFSMNTPIITGVGHETDTTLVDLVSDLRAATPTAAIEHAVRDQTDIMRRLRDNEFTLYKGLRKIINEKSLQLKHTSSHKLTQPHYLYQDQKTHLIFLEDNLIRHMERLLTYSRNLNEQWKSELYHRSPKIRITQKNDHIKHMVSQMDRQMKSLMKERQDKLVGQLELLNSLSPTHVMLRGYSYTEKEGSLLNSVEDVSKGDTIETKLTDGRISSEVIGVQKYDTTKNI